MKRADIKDKTLESLPFFPYIAWGLVFGFSFFVYNMSVRLNEVADRLDEQTTYLEEQAQKSTLDLKTTIQEKGK